MATVLIPREAGDGETRVAATPETVRNMIKAEQQVFVEAGAGEASGFLDEA